MGNIIVPFQVQHFIIEQLFYFEKLILAPFFFSIFDKNLFKFKNIHMFFITNVLHHGTSFDPKTYLIGNIALITGIPSSIKR
jgi:hypothetical protein